MNPSSVLSVLSELRAVVGVAEMRNPFDDATFERMVETTKKIIDDNFKDAVSKGAPDLAGSWIEILAALTDVEPQAMRDSKTTSAEAMRVRKTLGAEGYLFYKAPGSKFEFVYAPDQTPDHAKIDELKELRKKVTANRKAATPDEKEDHKKALQDVNQQIKDLENSDLMLASEKASARRKPADAEPEPLKATPEMKGLQKQLKAAEKAYDAATTPAEKTALEKQIASLEQQLSAETGTAEKARASGTAPKKKGATIKDPNDPNFDPEDPDAPPEAVKVYWKGKKIGGYKETAVAMKSVEDYGAAMHKALAVLDKDAEAKQFSGDRKTRLTNLLNTLRNTVERADIELQKVGVPKTGDVKKTAAEEVKNA